MLSVVYITSVTELLFPGQWYSISTERTDHVVYAVN